MTKIKNFYILVFVLIASWVSAQTYTSEQTNIYVSASTGDDTKDGTTWQKAFKTIDKAFENIKAGGTTNIYVAKGTYAPSNKEIQLGGGTTLNLYGNYPVPDANTVPIVPALPVASGCERTTTRPTTENLTKLDGSNVVNSTQFSFVPGTNGNSLNIQGFEITNYKPGSDGLGLWGSFVDVGDKTTNSKLTINNNNFDGVWADTYGVIALRATVGITLNIENNIIRNNQIAGTTQGGGFVGSIGSNPQNVTAIIKNNTINDYSTTGLDNASTIFDFRITPNTNSSLVYVGNKTCHTHHSLASSSVAGVLELNNVENVTITDNFFTDAQGGVAGAVHIKNAKNITLRNNLWQNNQAYDNGGALNIEGTAGNSLLLDNEKFYQNKVYFKGTSNKGGALLISQAFTTANIQNSEFNKNETPDAGGGVAITASSGTFNFTGNSFCSNSATNQGGGLYNYNSAVTVNINKTTFGGNYSKTDLGGGVFSSGPLNVTNSYFDGNYTVSSGGAIAVTGPLSVNNVKFTNNKTTKYTLTSGNGGAIFINDPSTGIGTDPRTIAHSITNASFLNNTAANTGGAIYAQNSNLTTTSNYFNANTAIHGGAVQYQSTLLVSAVWNSTTDIFKGNTAADPKNAAEGNGGAVNITTGGQSMNAIFTSAKFYANIANRDGGAVWVDSNNGSYDSTLKSGVTFTGTNTNNTEFLSNKATNGWGGALYVFTNMNALNYVKFYENSAKDGSPLKTGCISGPLVNSNTDIYIRNNNSCIWNAQIFSTTYTSLQNDSANYPSGRMGRGTGVSYNTPSFTETIDPAVGANITDPQKACVEPPAQICSTTVPEIKANIGVTDSMHPTPLPGLQTCNPVVKLYSTGVAGPVSYTYHYESYRSLYDAMTRNAVNRVAGSSSNTQTSEGTDTTVTATKLPEPYLPGMYYVFVLEKFSYGSTTVEYASCNQPIALVAYQSCAVDDTFGIMPGTTGSISVLANDKAPNGSTPVIGTAAGQVQLTQVSSTNDNVTLDPKTGQITVVPGTGSGTYTVEYKFCQQTALTTCSTAVATVIVPLDTDHDGIPDFMDMDDDNDGILDIAECPQTYATAEPGNLTWKVGNTNIFAFGGTQDGTGYQKSGFQKYVLTRGNELTAANNFDGSSQIQGFTGGNNSGYVVFSSNNNEPNTTKNEINTTDEWMSGSTGNSVKIDESGGKLPVGAYYQSTIKFKEPVNAFAFDLVDIYDTNIADEQIKTEIFVNGLSIGYIKNKYTGNDTSGQLALYSPTDVLLGNLTSGNNIEDSFGIVSQDPISEVIIRKTNIGTGPADVDPRGLDNFVFSTSTAACGNSTDEDSDDDGCPDAMEGSEDVTAAQVYPLNLDPTHPNYELRGRIKVTYDGTTVPSTPAGIISYSPDAYGVPQLVNNAGNNLNSATNPSNLAGVADATDTTADIGQDVGISQNRDERDRECFNACHPPVNTADNAPAVLHGITALQRAGANNGNWPMVRNSAYTALESKSKGFVVNQVDNPEEKIEHPVIGMMVYDGDETLGTNEKIGCLKINVDGSKTGWKCFNIPTCAPFGGKIQIKK